MHTHQYAALNDPITWLQVSVSIAVQFNPDNHQMVSFEMLPTGNTDFDFTVLYPAPERPATDSDSARTVHNGNDGRLLLEALSLEGLSPENLPPQASVSVTAPLTPPALPTYLSAPNTFFFEGSN